MTITILSKVAPIVAGFSLIAAAQSNPQYQEDGGWTWLWRIGLTGALAVFMTLCGILYRDLRNGQYQSETSIMEQHKENLAMILDLTSKQQRMIGVMAMLPMMMAKNATQEERFRYVQEIQKVLER